MMKENSMNILNENAELPEGSIVINMGSGNLFKYDVSGIDNLFIKGAVFQHKVMEEWFKVKHLPEIHKKISNHLITKAPNLNAAEFRFLRKELRLTIDQLCELKSLDFDAVSSWENEAGFICNEAITAVIELIERDFCATVESQNFHQSKAS